ncbi:fimbrial protein [Yersinia mollaretii]|uniref:fimbrial protein n=1 Tax=Yersinia mollaretii TaxID=33060 RepID=UPI0021BD60C9|nr:fimbrial protein [Yersinia mollaretii]
MFHFKSIKAKGFTRLSQLILICGGLVLLAPATAIAQLACKRTSTPPTFSNFKIEQNAPINTVIHKESFRVSLSCSNTNGPNDVNGFFFNTLSGNSSTNLKGIELKYTIKTENVNCSMFTSPTTGIIDVSCRNAPDTLEHPYIFSYDVEFIKLDNNHEVGTINHYPDVVIKYLSRLFDFSNEHTGYIHNTITPNNNIQVSGRGCTLDTPNLNFNLGKQQQKDFTGIGPIGSGPTQQIALTCDPNIKYSLQVDGDAEQGHPGVIKLTPESGAATGVGVQLLTGVNKDPVEFGKAKEMGTTAASGTDIKENIDITARYYQTAPTVTPGSANASATYTMTYQ